MQASGEEIQNTNPPLPPELWFQIASYIIDSERGNMALTCQLFHQVAHDESYWKRQCEAAGYKPTKEVGTRKGFNYENFYKSSNAYNVDFKTSYYVVGDHVRLTKPKSFFEHSFSASDITDQKRLKKIEDETITAAFPKDQTLKVFLTEEHARFYAKSKETHAGVLTYSTPVIFEVKLNPLNVTLMSETVKTKLGGGYFMGTKPTSHRVTFFETDKQNLLQIERGFLCGRKEEVQLHKQEFSMKSFLSRFI